MYNYYLPTREADLLEWSINFKDHIEANPTEYGLTVAQAAAYVIVHEAFADAYAVAQKPDTRTRASIQTKRDAKAALIVEARKLVKIIQGYPALTNTQRVELRITVPDVEPTPIPAPTSAPELTIVSTLRRTVTLRLRDEKDPDRRGRPTGVSGAAIFAYIGDDPPANPLQWSFLMNTSRTTLDIDFPSTVPGGSKVWLVAFWFNPRKQSGPASAAVNTRIDDGMAMKLAA